MFIIRWLLGRIILCLNFIFTPRSFKRSESEQKRLNQQTQHLSLYQLPACPFCVKVRRAIKRQGLQINTVSIKDEAYRDELLKGGGQKKVPCLKIVNEDESVTWLYESNDIISYLGDFT